MLRTPTAPLLLVWSLFAAACGGQTLNGPGTGDDGGVPADAAPSPDGRSLVDAHAADASGLGDGGCVDPVVGEACTETSSACPQVGNPCCIGYVWECQDGVWQQDDGVGCACEVEPDAAVDAGPDCGQPPEPTYDCASTGDAAIPDGGGCSAYGVDAGGGGPTYPLNCTVTLTTCDTSFGGAQTCNCEAFPGNGPQPTWVCPI